MARFSFLFAILSAIALPVFAGDRYLEATSLSTCMQNSLFSATLFNLMIFPDNGTLTAQINGVSQITGNVSITYQVLVYGYDAVHGKLNPCDTNLKGLCPMNTGDLNIPFNIQLGPDVISKVPGIAYTIPDLDAKVKVTINSTSTNQLLACVEANVSNGKTVYQPGVAWAVAVVAGLGLVISAVVSGLGHSNTAAHVAANALALFGYFQAQAMIGMTAVELPPMVKSWTQNFAWSMGIIRVQFLQTLATWYQRSTGGTPSTYLSALATTSVQVAKRSIVVADDWIPNRRDLFVNVVKRSNAATTNAETLKTITVRGIQRVGFVAGIEISNIFLTGYIFFLIFVIFVTLGVILFKFICEGLSKAGKINPDKFRDFRNGWHTVLKGILYRIIIIGWAQMVVLCFWEITQRDSAAEVVLAIATLITMILTIGWACLKVWRIARRSIAMHKNPAYILYSDPKALNKWGFLYVQFKATMYYFIYVVLIYILIKGIFIAFAQSSGAVQGVALLIIEAAMLITISIMRPYMDKKTNAFNIAIASVNFFNVIVLLFFTGILGVPPLAIGVLGVLFFFVNVVFALVLLIMVLWASGWALMSKNPDTRYQPMRDDRGSFIKSQTNLGTTELDALGAIARGEGKTMSGNFSQPNPYHNAYGMTERKRALIDDDIEVSSFSDSTGAMPTPIHSRSDNQLGSQFHSVQSPAPAYDRSASPVGGNVYRPPTANSTPNRAATASPWQRGVGY